jgi:hypothetical protein
MNSRKYNSKGQLIEELDEPIDYNIVVKTYTDEEIESIMEWCRLYLERKNLSKNVSGDIK